MYSLLFLLPLLGATSALAPGSKPVLFGDANAVLETRGLGTSADVYIYNDWQKPLIVSSPGSSHMSTTPPASFQVAPGAVSNKFFVEADGWVPKQSNFTISLKPEDGKESTIGFDIGMSPYKTRFTLGAQNPTGQVGVMLAPAKILEKGRDFDFHIFSGAGAFTSFAQIIIDQKLPGILAGLKEKPAVLPISKDLEVTINDIVNPSIKLAYVNLGTGKNGMLLNTIVDISGEVKLTASFKGFKQNASVKLGGISALVTGEGSLPAIDVTRLQVSITSIELEGDILVDIIGALYPIFTPILKLPYKIASIINTSENQKILAMLNAAIKAFFP